MGIGIPQYDNWPEQLGRIYFPTHVVYNAGLGGSSADTVARLALNLIPIIKPEVVAIFWPPIGRFETYHHGTNNDEMQFNGPWSFKRESQILFEENNLYNNQMKNKAIIQQLKKIYNFSLIELDVDDEFKNRQTGIYPTARDHQHLAGEWHRDVAEDFYNKYKLENLI